MSDEMVTFDIMIKEPEALEHLATALEAFLLQQADKDEETFLFNPAIGVEAAVFEAMSGKLMERLDAIAEQRGFEVDEFAYQQMQPMTLKWPNEELADYPKEISLSFAKLTLSRNLAEASSATRVGFASSRLQ